MNASSSHKTLITVIGPTAIGKTSLGIALAKHFETEIISCDSRQFFKEMRIGTAVPTEKELKAAKHHFIQHISIERSYSVGDFERDAIFKLNELFKRHDTIIMVGGSGLYVDAVTRGLDDFPDIDPKIRESLNEKLASEGIETLQTHLKELDSQYYSKVDIENPHRLIRALEVCMGTGKPYSSFLQQKENKRNFRTISVGLIAERDIIYDRINRRVDLMMEEGLLEEAKSLYPKRQLNALQTVGYKELFNYFEGTWTLEFAVSEIKKNTRRFAKRQLTWFKRNEDSLWFDYTTRIEEIAEGIENRMVEIP